MITGNDECEKQATESAVRPFVERGILDSTLFTTDYDVDHAIVANSLFQCWPSLCGEIRNIASIEDLFED